MLVGVGGEVGVWYKADGLLQKSDKLVFKLAIAPQLLKCPSGLASHASSWYEHGSAKTRPHII